MSACVTLPIVCAWCERVRTSAGWEESSAPPRAEHATHGICPECLATEKRAASAEHAVDCL
ncbi:MAG: hypothetical protein ACHP85_06890 [Burkholderiales bacterium]